eukprot:4536990-Pleurochrysis_carterae.AAC.1
MERGTGKQDAPATKETRNHSMHCQSARIEITEEGRPVICNHRSHKHGTFMRHRKIERYRKREAKANDTRKMIRGKAHHETDLQ